MAAEVHHGTIGGTRYHVLADSEHRRGRTRARPATLDRVSASQKDQSQVELPRAASYTYLEQAKENHYSNPALVTRCKDVLDATFTPKVDKIVDISPPDSSGWNTPEETAILTIAPLHPQEIVQKLENVPNDQSRSNIDLREIARGVESSAQRTRNSLESTRSASAVASTPAPTQNRQSFSKTISKRFARQSWYQSRPTTPSRTPSPQKSEAGTITESVSESDNGAPRALSATRRRSYLLGRARSKSKSRGSRRTDSPTCELQEPVQAITRSESHGKKARPVSEIFRLSSTDVFESQLPGLHSSIPAVPKLPKSFSTDRLPSIRAYPGQSTGNRAAPVPRLVNAGRTSATSISVVKKKDELWSVFRTLDGDYSKFASKSTSLKANVVRSTLMPFLRAYAEQRPSLNLRPEDLDRRANILNKWWTGLLEMLHGRNNQSMSGTDRPIILDGISGIMERPEWRLSPSPFCKLVQRVAMPLNQSTTSLSSSASDFLLESVHYNVRNIFIQNLSSQMAFVVDKMSARNASASLVAFCGKACAFAFMFVPGVADVLVRLWEAQADTLRRVLDENGIGKFDHISEAESGAIVSNFPPALQKLGFTSLIKYVRKLRTPPPLPAGLVNVHWWGRWLERWTGRESDLFYVFVKHFHFLVSEFLPLDSTKRDRLCAPGLLLVHAQILVNLDATIHRDASSAQSDSAQSPTFDDVLADPDAHASTLPVAPVNAVRLMAENRLIMLIRDFLSERTADHPIPREIFALAFNDLLQACARGTSVYDHAACYTLLDFMEEALIILVRYEQIKQTPGTIINSMFWQSVCKRMISSENTMTEIRLYAFLYTIWTTVVTDPFRRRNICMGLLLDEEIFQSRFNHWCPMVRAYYMRLLCWRVARFDSENTAFDELEIFETMLERLRTTWSHYLWLRETAQEDFCHPPPTNPCHPAPGRRLLIIRTDAIVTGKNSWISFDGLSLPSSPIVNRINSWKRDAGASSLLDDDTRPNSSYSSLDLEADDPDDRGIGGLFRKIIGSTRPRTKSHSVPKRPATAQSAPPIPNFSTPFRSVSDDRRASIQDIPFQPVPAQDVVLPHRSYSFKFSLEFLPAAKAPPSIHLYPPKLPLPAQIYLQAHTTNHLLGAYMHAVEPTGAHVARARYCGRALAEWMLVVSECQSFFDRRKNEGVPSNCLVETPTLGVEMFRRPS